MKVRKATAYAAKIADAASLDELRALWSEITANRADLGEMYAWLADFKDSRKFILSSPPIENVLTKEGIKWLKKSGRS